jgi:hypothetical protein
MPRKSIAEMNREFEGLTPAEKRVRIARDVLAQLREGKIVPTQGMYLAGRVFAAVRYDDFGASEKLDSVIRSRMGKGEQCNVCALGAVFTAAVLRADGLTVDEIREKGVGARPDWYLKDFFTDEAMDAIETAFEVNKVWSGGETTDELFIEHDPARWDDYRGEYVYDARLGTDKHGRGRSRPSAELRMRLIMENIVANGGSFRPSRRPRWVETVDSKGRTTGDWVTPGYEG